MRGKALSGKEKNKKIILSQQVKKGDLEQKIRVLLNFGFERSEVVSLFADREFSSLRALDCFADKLIKEKLENL